ncbi:sulfatase family protein [Bythopirellula polymerisocia]|uniref:Arylsulfatase n=1 Tax=Bythopirellula polymerisocia TaxID=2528003 RepID=A0A5C6CEN6_9BACT|nr:sulfatase [Bythopirellula polymerisocia]TWU21891.1 Arylsulfatase [Bythopirellula polymerisocia]
MRFTICLIMLCLWLLVVATANAAARPNILFVFADDHAYQAISAYGSRINETPNIDRLAHEGMRFDNCFVTNSICGPCRATILTGKYSHLNGFLVNGNRFDGSQQTFPKLMQAAGYATAMIGKWHLESDPTGFDHWDILVGQGTYYNPNMIRNGEPTKNEGYSTEIITDKALDWLKDGRDPSKPFMLMYQQKAPHRPWDPGPRQLDLYEDETIPEPPTLFEDYSLRGTAVNQQDMTIAETMDKRDLKLVPPENLTAKQKATWDAAYEPRNKAFRAANLSGAALVRWKYQRYIKDYLRCVASVDEQLGRVLDWLDETGLADNTLVVYCSDQGFYLGEHGWFDKRWMYEESLRTPLLARWPGTIEPGSLCNAIVSPLDFAETFLEVAGAEIPADMQGRSLLPLFHGETPSDWRKTFYYHYYEYPGWHQVRRHYGVTDGRFKLIYFYEPDVDEWELYDLQLDKNELQNVYDNRAYASVRKRLEGELKRLRAELKVPEEDPPASNLKQNAPRTRKPTAMKKAAAQREIGRNY